MRAAGLRRRVSRTLPCAAARLSSARRLARVAQRAPWTALAAVVSLGALSAVGVVSRTPLTQGAALRQLRSASSRPSRARPVGGPARGDSARAGPARAGRARGGADRAGPARAGPGAADPVPAALVDAGRVRYRVVGCRSKGDVAYLHGARRREVAIGFDDGPAPDTSAFVRMLQQSHAQATFFMIGEQVSAVYRQTLLRELADGDALGDHTFTHPNLSKVANVRAQLERTIAAIQSLSGYRPCVFRPPYGAYNGSIVRIARSLGLATVLWNVDPSDYTRPGIATIERRVLAQVQPGSIVISHDGGGSRGQTLHAYPAIIAALRARGYRIVTIPELLGFRPVYVPCIRLCEGIGIARRELPREAILERAPSG